MLFNSFAFLLLFFPLTWAALSRARGRALLFGITAASLVFYSYAGHAWFLIPMLVTTLLDFAIAPRIAEARAPGRRRLLLLLSLGANLGLLFWFKYSGLFSRTFGDVIPFLAPFAATILPAGISFYTFQTMSYVIDVYRGHARPEKSLWTFTSFVSFFPHLVAGPLTRHHQLIPGLKRIAREGIRPRWEAGIFLFAMGLCKKTLIADRIAGFIDPMLNGLSLDPSQATAGFGASPTWGAWICMLGYALQIYFDFSGYSDMALGLARLFGIELPQNFDSPYQARDPSDFWRRWHISLSQWLRDYLYISLGGNRCAPWRRHLNLMITMVLGGLWHGASWTFAAWGFYHGALLVVFHAVEKPWKRLPAALQRALTFLLVCVGWVFFRAQTFEQAWLWLRALAGLAPAPAAGSADAGAPAFGAAFDPTFLLLLAAGLGIAHLLPNASHDEKLESLGPARQAALALLAVAAIVFMNYSSRFLYYQF